MIRHVYLHSEDLDGWLSQPNRPLLSVYAACLSELQGLTNAADGETHEIQVVLNSGKSPDYLEDQASVFGGRFVIACGGAAWRECGSATRAVAPACPDLASLRSLLGIPCDAEGVVPLLPPGAVDEPIELAIEEGKRLDGTDLVLSFFPEQEPVRHRWRFHEGTNRHALHGLLRDLIEEHSLALAVLEPHRDGAVDVVPFFQGRPVTKWTLPRLARRMFPDSVLHLTHGGDGLNDVDAMEADDVLPLTARNCVATRAVAHWKGGVVAERDAPQGGAAIECYLRLAEREFYGALSPTVGEICSRHLS